MKKQNHTPFRMSPDTCYVWCGGSCNYASKQRESAGAYVMERNGARTSTYVTSDTNTTEFRMILTVMIHAMNSLPEKSDIIFLTNVAYIQNYDIAPTEQTANADLIRACIAAKQRHNEVKVKIVSYHKYPQLSETHAMAHAAMREIRDNSYKIREISPSDDASILKIARRAFEEHGAPLTGSVYCDPRMEHLSQEFLRDDAKYWVIEDAIGKVLGGGGFYPTEGLPDGMAEVVKLYFSPSLRGKGYGRKMLSLIEREAQKMGYKSLYIESFPEFARAVSLYESLGFRHITRVLGNSGHPAVTVWMTKTL